MESTHKVANIWVRPPTPAYTKSRAFKAGNAIAFIPKYTAKPTVKNGKA
jgi:hypothetical protein